MTITDDSDSEKQKRIERFNWLVKRAAKVIGAPSDHQRAVVQGGIDFAYERMLDEMIASGKLKEPNAFVKLSELELASAPPIRQTPVINISFADPDTHQLTTAIDAAIASDDAQQMKDILRKALESNAPADDAERSGKNTPASDAAPLSDEDAEFKEKFGKTAHRGVPPSPPPEPDYMDGIKAQSKELGFMPNVDLARAMGQPAEPVRNMGGFTPSDVGGANRPPNPFSVIRSQAGSPEPVPGSPGTVDNLNGPDVPSPRQ